MTHAVESIAWTGQTPWHSLGFKVEGNLTPAQMGKAAKVDWTVSKRKMFFEAKDGKHIEAPADYALVRDSDESHLSTVGATWKPVQNEVSLEFFDKFVKAGHMTMETVGSLWGGRYIWALARIGKDFNIGKDEMRSYLLLASPHVRGKAFLIMYTSVRVVCWNTLTAAIGANWGKDKSKKDDGSIFRMPHSTAFDDFAKQQAEEALGLATKQTTSFKEAVTLLSKTRIKPEDTETFFCEILQFDPKKAEKKKGGEVKEPRMLPKFRAALEHAPGQQLPSATGTLWGAYNAVSYVVDHETGRDRDSALKNIWLGHLAGVKRKAFDMALAKAR